MTDLAAVLEEIGLSQYLETFIEHGFDTWTSFADITEPDFDVIGVKLGHRRKIQRKIADARGISSYQPLVSPSPNTPNDDRPSDENKSTIPKPDVKDSTVPSTGKRKYRRHPKPDENAPERPPSAYVIFSNKMRDDLKGRHLSFTEIAKLVGEHWQALAPNEKEPFESQAFGAKEKFNSEMMEYKKTENFTSYMTYLADFKEKHPSQQQAAEVTKRPKLINEPSGGSSGVDSSAASHHSSDVVPGHGRGGSVSSIGPPWFAGDPSPAQPTQQHLPTQLNLTGPHGTLRESASPSTPSNNILPGYRDAIFRTNQQTLAWRDNTRDAEVPPGQQLPRIINIGDRRSGQLGSGSVNFDSQAHNMPTAQSSIRTSTKFSPPPLLTSESTAGTTSSTSSILYPRTPLEPSLDRSLPMPGQMYPTKPPPLYESQQLPPLRASSSTSPKTLSAYKSPTNIPPISDFSSTAQRGFPSSTQAPTMTLPSIADHNYHHSGTTNDDEALDPVSALLRADEIVSRQASRR